MKSLVAGNLKSKTSWFGIGLIILGALEQSGLMELVPDEWKGFALSTVGFLTLVLRNLTTMSVIDKAIETKEDDANDQAGFARLSLLAALSTTLVVVLALAACAPTQVKPTSVISIACAPGDQYQIERCAEAVGDVYAVYLERVHALVANPATPEKVRAQLQALDRELTPSVRLLVQASAAYVQLREASATPATVSIAEQALRQQLAAVEPKVRTLPQL